MGNIIWPSRFGVPATDPHFANTKLLLSCDGTNGSTTFTDQSASARGNATRAGINNDAQVSTSFQKFGSGCLLLDGNADTITFPDSADWTFAGDFTIETWALFDSGSLNANQGIINHWDATTSQRSWALAYRGDLSPDELQFSVSSNGTAVAFTLSAIWTPTAATYYHLAVDRSGNVWRLYIDGTMVASTTSATALFNSNTLLRIGTQATSYMAGRQDEIRITGGVARYATNGSFTVPSAAYPRS